ncbi:MAG: hypothetical protein E7520_04480 [Ruminococcaceae bacterium]|nr:hypothetical protein [Oscillospiraceae bacterium]
MSKKILSAMLAIVMAFVPFVYSLPSLAETYPYVERDAASGEAILYHRSSNNQDLAFSLDYNEMVAQVRAQLINHAESIDYYFATTDETFAYTYAEDGDYDAALAVANQLYDTLMTDVFEINSTAAPTVGGGEYLFNSIKSLEESSERIFDIGSVNMIPYPSWGDEPQEGETRYYPFHIMIDNITYYTTPEQERVTASFAEWFSSHYIDDTMTAYQKVKTIYDFIVRNTTYDWDVYYRNSESGTAITESRYNIAHSAYGAICGNILDENDNASILQNLNTLYKSKRTVTYESVPVTADQGKAVCEGYSKLFYYLCTYNGIRCHIVDGDYTADSGKSPDAHEWNFVFLQDDSGEGWKWFQVDCTRAAQNSLKIIDFNNYNYFLGGYDSVYFGYKNHQQAYEDKGTGVKPQLYDWWQDAAHTSSQKDYIFDEVKMTSNNLAQGYIVRRTTRYPGSDEDTVSYISYDRYGAQILEITEEGLTLKETEGFVYTGTESEFTVIVPYLVNRTNVLDNGTVSEGEYLIPSNHITNVATGESASTATTSGSYVLTVIGAENSSLDIDFAIVPRNMSKEAISGDCIVYNPKNASYTGRAIIPSISVVDPKNNTLVSGRDYTITYHLDGVLVSEIKDIGNYTITIHFKGNYRGSYPLDFTVGKVDLSTLSYELEPFQYLPKYYREQNNLNTPLDYYTRGTQNGLHVGELTFYLNQDFTATYTGDLEYGKNRGTITLRGKAGSKIDETKTLTVPYDVTVKYDISSFEGKAADTNTTNKVYYTGSAVKPTKFDVLDKYLERGKDYEITGYSENNDAGYAWVHIKGIGGCTGTAKMQFYINPSSQQPGSGTQVDTSGYVKPTTTGNTFKLSCTKYTYDGKKKKPTVTFKNSKGKSINTYYYTVSYTGNTNPGTAYAVVKLRNGYSGTFKIAFTINPKGTSLTRVSAVSRGFKAKWKKQATQTTGYQIQYSTSKKFSSAKTVTVSKNSTVSKKVTKLKAKKKYYIRVRTYKTVSGKKYYSSWSKALSVTTKK